MLPTYLFYESRTKKKKKLSEKLFKIYTKKKKNERIIYILRRLVPPILVQYFKSQRSRPQLVSYSVHVIFTFLQSL